MNHQHEVLTAVNALEEYWSEVGCKSPRLLESRIPTKLWQKDLATYRTKRLSDVIVFSDGKVLGTIDLLDQQQGIAFQLRVFGEAPEKDFYEEVFKVAIYNRSARKKIQKLVFITRDKCAEELSKGLPRAVCSTQRLLGFQIEIIGIDGEDFG